MAEVDSLQTLRQYNQTLLQQLRQGQTRFRDLLNESGLSLSDTSLIAVPAVNGYGGYGKASSSHSYEPGVVIGRHVPTDGARDKLTACKAPVIEQGYPNCDAQNTGSTLPEKQVPKMKKYTPVGMVSATAVNPQEKEFFSDASAALEAPCDINTDHTRTSTPMATPTKQGTNRDTPRSILKHRKIIDDNVHVDSKFDHTPNAAKSGRNGLNFSYSNVDDLDLKTLQGVEAEPAKITPPPAYMKESELDGSYLEECASSEKKKQSQKSAKDTANFTSKKGDELTDPNSSMAREIEELYKKRLLLAEGNDRQNKQVVEQLERRPKSVVFESAEKTLEKASGRNPTKVNSRSKPADSDRGQPLLGYDWIAGLLDNENSLNDQDDEYFDRIREFRRTNRQDCVNTGPLSSVLDIGRPISPEIKDPEHTCIHGFNVNDRLFVEPHNIGEDGKSVCPICLIPRKEPTQQSPGFVRVSIPRSTLETPYKIKPHRRRSFDPTDSCALSQHCLAGWECSRPAMLPTAANLDLKHASHGLKAQLSSTVSEAEAVAQSYSRSSRTATAPRSKVTEDLLNASCALSYDLQMLEKGRGFAGKRPPNSTRYPAL